MIPLQESHHAGFGLPDTFLEQTLLNVWKGVGVSEYKQREKQEHYFSSRYKNATK